ncbi:MAG: CDP-glucose 4,6-dehydratase [Planctomycetia bacterium]
MEGVGVRGGGGSAPFGGAFAGARVLVTGHTGFKGSWLCEWLLALGADVTGYALEPDTTPSLFAQLGLADRLRHHVGDIRDAGAVGKLVDATRPRFVFHLAAQPIVRRSYREAHYTWETNVMGTINVLEALRRLEEPCAAVMVTTDKCYENREWLFGYRENDPLGGHDPYSSSKAGAELAIASWRSSFFTEGHPVRIASARAGNVIGGGDWAEDRIVPDSMRALSRGEPIHVRNPSATRPWQHVLEPDSGYLALAAALALRPEDRRLDSAFNIGPGHDANQPVRNLVAETLRHWPGEWIDHSSATAPHEASLLQLDNGKIEAIVGWRPAWTFREAVGRTVAWYRDMHEHRGASAARDYTLRDISAYVEAAAGAEAAWTGPDTCPLPSVTNA